MFNGLALVHELREHGHQVWILNRGKTQAELPKGVERLYCDRTDHAAMRQALGGRYPSLERLRLTDYKVRVLETSRGTGAVTRVLIDSTDGERSWSTIGVSENIIEASWQALVDSFVFGLLHAAD